MDWKGASEAAAGASSAITTTSTTTVAAATGTAQLGLGVCRTSQDKNYQQEKKATDLSNPTTRQVLSHHKKNKPIPPPLDLSIGAANLSLHQQHIHLHHPTPNSHHQHHHSHSNSANPNLHQPPPPQPPNQNQAYQHQQPYLGSPKFTQSDKNLPLRKRWHSWSPIPMNGQDEAMVPLFPDTHVSSNKAVGVGDTPQSPLQQPPPYQPYSSPSPVSTYTRTSPAGHYGHGIQANHGHVTIINSPSPPNIVMTNANTNIMSGSLGMSNHNHHHHHQSMSVTTTPTPFYTPNEPSPKFMNSPVFSYSNPDTSLYQGPFSPMRASSLYPPPNSPFTNLNLNSPLAPIQINSTVSVSNSSNMGPMGNNSVCFNMIPSTLLSPAPSQASTNSLSYEDLHEKSLSFLAPAWSIFLPGTKVRFASGMNCMDWYLADFLTQSGDTLGLKGEYAPHGLEVRKFVVTSSAKERIQVTFCPVADPHPTIEVNCEPGHPFMVDKKGWCAIKPDVFQETYGTPCQTLECGDICISFSAARSPNQYSVQQHHNNSQVFPMTSVANHNGFMNGNSGNCNNGISGHMIKIEPEEKPVPVSVVPQHPICSPLMPIQSTSIINKKLNSIPISAPASPAKKAKDSCPAPGETKGRRPMNAFLLFAKDKRPELIQLYPGKDNRSISVLLGEAWQTLNPVDKDRYAESAKRNAEEQKRMHPDCWKRKRSQSTSS